MTGEEKLIFPKTRPQDGRTQQETIPDKNERVGSGRPVRIQTQPPTAWSREVRWTDAARPSNPLPQACFSLSSVRPSGTAPRVRTEPWMVTDGGCHVALEAWTTRTSRQAPPKPAWRTTDFRARCVLVPPPNPPPRPHHPPLPGARTLKEEWVGKCLHSTARKGGSELRPLVSNFIIEISNVYKTGTIQPPR